MTNTQYRGRFAPSPTGPLHFGSLVAAAGSYLDARAHGGEWCVRMEDVDVTRCSPHWSADILHTLEAFGLSWDGPVIYQTSPDRQAAYTAALDSLERAGFVYPCGCSRKEVEDSPNGARAIYPGTCRSGIVPGKTARSFRLRVPDEVIRFTDRSFGPIEQNLATAVGDFILKRADGPFAYQLAVVVDDAKQGITDIVRGQDLLDSTPRQIYLQRLLDYPEPRYLHLPMVTNATGQKLSKQTGAAPLMIDRATAVLLAALAFLGLGEPPELRGASIAEIWEWAIPAWQLAIGPTCHFWQ